jgi:DNA repair protein RecN (Recombination protein N)
VLISLAIRDIVLIERLDLGLEGGLCVLTGETGAGKSILLDALGLALGGRGDRALVRQGAERGSVVAAFALAADDPASLLLAEHEIEPEELLVLRRVLGADGRSRAYVNDQPVGSALLRRLGQLVVEVHGQHEQQGLLDAATQRRLLDAYGRLEAPLAAVQAAHGRWRQAEAGRAALAEEAVRTASDEAYWRHALAELDQLAPQVGEEEALAEARARLMNRDKLVRAIDEALGLLRGQGGVEARLAGAERVLVRASGAGDGLLEGAAAALERTRVEAEEAAAALERAGAELESGGERLDQIEERLFALRAAARKHRVEVDALAQLREDVAARLAVIDAGGERLAAAEAEAAAARRAFVEQAVALSEARAGAAAALERAVMAELPPLRLDKARFSVRLQPLAEDEWSAEGRERVAFEVATNPGQEPGPLARIASGGELARLMLALKVVLARTRSTPCLIFDEVDTGIGGATADAVGERLARLARDVQVLVVTHAPQVAARADHHFRVEKQTRGEVARVTVTPLGAAARREEIARMLAGATITEAARAAADSLMAASA